MKIGFIGVGVMGKSMVYNLVKNGFEVEVYARNLDKIKDVLERGIPKRDTIAELVKNNDVIITIVGLICAMTPLGKVPAVEELSGIYLYMVVSLLASMASLTDLVSAPMWVVYGFVILVIHVVLMFVLSKLFKWDLCMVSTASLANIGGSASAPIVATAYDASYAGIGVLMGVLGAAVGNFFGLGMGAILSMIAGI